MPSLTFEDGGLVYRDGALGLDENCCCGGGDECCTCASSFLTPKFALRFFFADGTNSAGSFDYALPFPGPGDECLFEISADLDYLVFENEANEAYCEGFLGTVYFNGCGDCDCSTGVGCSYDLLAWEGVNCIGLTNVAVIRI